MSFCPDCGVHLDKEDIFCRKCGKSLQPVSKPRPASAKELAKIAGMQERIKMYGGISNWLIILGVIVGLLVVIPYASSLRDWRDNVANLAVLWILVGVPFNIVGFIMVYYKGKLHEKLEKGELD